MTSAMIRGRTEWVTLTVAQTKSRSGKMKNESLQNKSSQLLCSAETGVSAMRRLATQDAMVLSRTAAAEYCLSVPVGHWRPSL
jgi:hypothetical protein